MELQKQQEEQYDRRRVKSVLGVVRIRTYNWKDSRCTDHRLGQNFPLTTFQNGDLGQIHSLCIADEQQALMKEMLDGA